MNDSFKRPFTFDRVVRILIGVTVAIALFLLLKRLSGVLLPFLVAWLIAYMLYPIVKLFQFRLKVRVRILAILLTFLTVGIVLGLILFLIIPPIISEVTRTSDLLAIYMQHIQQVNFIPQEIKVPLLDWVHKIDVEKLLSKDYFAQGVEVIVPQLWNLLSSSVSLIISLVVVFIVFLYTVFILTDYERINNGWIQLVPEKYRVIVTRILEDLEQGMNRYFRGQALIASIVGVLLATGFTIIDLPLGMLLGLIMGVFAMVPYLNVVMFPVLAFFAFLKSVEMHQPFWLVAVSVVAVIVTVQMIQDFFLTPKIMGRVMGMKPAVILLSLSIWGSLLGIAGMIIALPATTILTSYYKRFIIGNDSITDITPLEKKTDEEEHDTNK
jgi:predicted PurR-regulated permease PerM